jgi:membrane protease YdiL (CAAX protease family)
MKSLIKRYPIRAYFILVFLISYGSFLLLVGPQLLRGGSPQASTAESLLFPILVLGVALVGLALTWTIDGKAGLKELLSHQTRWRVGITWYGVALLTIPILILIVLFAFRSLVSPVFAPKFFPAGILFGLPAFLEEIGWMGYAFPRMRLVQSPFLAALLLGVLWGLWHAPVVDYLGAAAPHGAYWLPFFIAFIAIVTAVRILIAWVYQNTGSLLLTQLMHLSFAGSLVVFGPGGVSPMQEVLWYGGLAAVLWMVVAGIVWAFGSQLKHQTRSSTEMGAA